MKHKLIEVRPWGTTYEARIELIPDTAAEQKAMKNIDTGTATDKERQLIANYTNSIQVPGYVIVGNGEIDGTIFIVNAKKSIR